MRNTTFFPDKETKIIYTISKYREEASLSARPYIDMNIQQRDRPRLDSLSDLLDELRKSFGDSDEKRTAERELTAIVIGVGT